jgi:undecaprenyl-diphosphatase
MKKVNKKSLYITIGLFAAFMIYTIMTMFVDVRPIGPEGSSVGFAAANGPVHDALPYNETFDKITDIIMYLSFLTVFVWGLVGVLQLVKKKSLKEVDSRLYVLLLFYAITVIIYVFFDKVPINYRPVILDEGLEPSYPSTHNLMTLAFFGFTIVNLKIMDVKKQLSGILTIGLGILCVLMPILRLMAGVHWLTDIIGGIILSIALVMAYNTAVNTKDRS